MSSLPAAFVAPLCPPSGSVACSRHLPRSCSRWLPRTCVIHCSSVFAIPRCNLYELVGKFRSAASIFVFEKDIGFLPGVRPYFCNPLGEGCLRVFFASQSQVTPGGGVDEVASGQVFGIRDAEGTFRAAKAVEYFIVEPAWMAKLKSRLHSAGDKTQEGF